MADCYTYLLDGRQCAGRFRFRSIYEHASRASLPMTDWGCWALFLMPCALCLVQAVLASKTYEQFYARIGLPFPGTLNLAHLLRDAIVRSAEKGYHGSTKGGKGKHVVAVVTRPLAKPAAAPGAPIVSNWAPVARPPGAPAWGRPQALATPAPAAVAAKVPAAAAANAPATQKPAPAPASAVGSSASSPSPAPVVQQSTAAKGPVSSWAALLKPAGEASSSSTAGTSAAADAASAVTGGGGQRGRRRGHRGHRGHGASAAHAHAHAPAEQAYERRGEQRTRGAFRGRGARRQPGLGLSRQQQQQQAQALAAYSQGEPFPSEVNPYKLNPNFNELLQLSYAPYYAVPPAFYSLQPFESYENGMRFGPGYPLPFAPVTPQWLPGHAPTGTEPMWGYPTGDPQEKHAVAVAPFMMPPMAPYPMGPYPGQSSQFVGQPVSQPVSRSSRTSNSPRLCLFG